MSLDHQRSWFFKAWLRILKFPKYNRPFWFLWYNWWFESVIFISFVHYILKFYHTFSKFFLLLLPIWGLKSHIEGKSGLNYATELLLIQSLVIIVFQSLFYFYLRRSSWQVKVLEGVIRQLRFVKLFLFYQRELYVLLF